jgi:membrane protease YdiL (CAAX protease family)
MVATASCWWLGIVVFDSDYVFTVTNVIIHGVPYFVLTQRYARASGRGLAGRIALHGLVPVLLFCLVFALAEEALWDRWVWHEHAEYFGEVFPLTSSVLTFVVPLLALPQASHYVLDGFLWRVRRENLVLRRELESG